MAIFTVVTMNEEFDPTLEIEVSGGEGLSEEETAAAVENMQAAEQERAAVQAQYAEQEEQAVEVNKPEGANLGDYIVDTVKAPIAGVRDAAANLITFPERVIDMASGEAGEEGYEPEWDDFLYGEEDPLETKTWWGGLIRGVTEAVSYTHLTLPTICSV